MLQQMRKSMVYPVRQVTLALAEGSLLVFDCSDRVLELSYRLVRHQSGFAYRWALAQSV
jgi:hypothetical protein